MNRRTMLGAMLGGAPAPAPERRPNILFVMTDEQRFGAVGYANPVVQTPHLDKLAGDSVVFTNAYSTSPSCVRARAAIYTGRPTHCFLDGHHLPGVRDNRWKLVHYGDRPYGELYDLNGDPWEKRNLWADAPARAVKAELQSRLLDHLIETGRSAESEWNTNAPPH